MANHYVIIDGVLCRSTPSILRWNQRVAKALPLDIEEKPDVVALPTEDRRSDWEIIESLDETPEL